MVDTAMGPGFVSRFGAFVLDTERALLLRGGRPVALRPKAYALLTYLARHPGRVLGKEELLAAVWPGVVVSDESLSQCVRELRTVLGDERQALIRTVPRRGYLFEPAVDPPLAPDAQSPASRSRRGAWAAAALAGVAVIVGALVLAQGSPSPARSPIDTRPAIAVLPFADRGDDNHFGDGVAEDLTIALVRRPGTLVVSFVSAAAVAARESDPRRIGHALGARHLLAGSVERDGPAAEIHARLLSVDTGAALWSGRFRYDNIVGQSWRHDLGDAVARALELPTQSAADATLAGLPTVRSLEAFDALLKARHQQRHVANLADLRRARLHYQQALAADPDSTDARTGVARTYLEEIGYGWASDRSALVAQAEQLLQSVLDTDPGHLMASAQMGSVRRERGDIEGALRHYQKVLAAAPNWAWGHANCAAMKLQLGRPQEVLVHADMALRLSPFEPTLVGYSHLWAGIAEFYLGREDAAYERMRQSAGAGPNPTRFGALLWLTSLDALHGRQTQASQHLAALMQVEPGFTVTRWRRITALTHPTLAAGRERFAEGMRRAGVPE